MQPTNAVCVYCGSSAGFRHDYRDAAVQLGRALAQRKLTLIYGGAHRGLMGILADAVLEAGGKVTGVIPQALVDKEIAHTGLTELRIVDSMHARKLRMASLADAFVLMPGGFGSWDEFCEVVTWAQLGIHTKRCGVLNVAGYYDSLLAQVQHAVAEGFVRPVHGGMIVVETNPASLLDSLTSPAPPLPGKWA